MRLRDINNNIKERGNAMNMKHKIAFIAIYDLISGYNIEKNR